MMKIKLLDKIFYKEVVPEIPVATELDPEHGNYGAGRRDEWKVPFSIEALQLTKANEFPIYDEAKEILAAATDASESTEIDGKAMDDDGYQAPEPINSKFNSEYTVPEGIMRWYATQSFIGYQACAIIAQQWLVNKACSMAGEDAARNGWDIKADDGSDLDSKTLFAIRHKDIQMEVTKNLKEFNRFKNIFGIRVAIFQVKSDDSRYYEKPFNIDSVTKGSYYGISQVDPYWMTPMLTADSTADPSGQHFYEPDYWIISGQKYHRSHLSIAIGDEVADILKPTYIFGGVSLVQVIYERCYAAERTANEAPLLAMNKRMTIMHTDMDQVMADEDSFLLKMQKWVFYRDNNSVKIVGLKESLEQIDTNLTDLDSVIMNQYQLVSAIAKVPATKLLGTSPKGFNASGEFEIVSYHEELESIQNGPYQMMLDHHYLLMAKSMGLSYGLTVVWQPVDSLTATQRAALNYQKAQTGEIYVNLGVISPDDEFKRVKNDKFSGYNQLEDNSTNESNPQAGMTPENIAALEKAGAEQKKGEAAVSKAVDPQAPEANPDDNQASLREKSGTTPPTDSQNSNFNEQRTAKVDVNKIKLLRDYLTQIDALLVPEGQDINPDITGHGRSVRPSVTGIRPNVSGISSVIEKTPRDKMQRMKINGMICYVENPRDSIRKGEGQDGPWSIKMPHHYGFIDGTKGADGDELDCFIGRNLNSKRVFVIDQYDENGNFDEHKCMIGFNNSNDAKDAYLQSFKPGWKGFGGLKTLSVNNFKQFAAGNCNTPLCERNIAEQTTNAPIPG
jgi:phage-related protein (TIGR01555 family)